MYSDEMPQQGIAQNYDVDERSSSVRGLLNQQEKLLATVQGELNNLKGKLAPVLQEQENASPSEKGMPRDVPSSPVARQIDDTNHRLEVIFMQIQSLTAELDL